MSRETLIVTDVNSVKELIDKYYKPDRAHRTEEGYKELIRWREECLVKYGRAEISHHDSVNGRDITYYG